MKLEAVLRALKICEETCIIGEVVAQALVGDAGVKHYNNGQ